MAAGVVSSLLVLRTLELSPMNGAARARSIILGGSVDMRAAAFAILALALVPQQWTDLSPHAVINLVSDVFVHDRRTRRTIRASADGGEEWMEGSRTPSLDDTGRVIVFASRHPRNDHDDTHDEDLYIRLAKPVERPCARPADHRLAQRSQLHPARSNDVVRSAAAVKRMRLNDRAASQWQPCRRQPLL